MTTFGDNLYHMGGVPVGGMLTNGKSFFVNPYYGTGAGKKINQAMKTLSGAHTLSTASKNDVVYLVAGSNTAAYTTDYQSYTLTWSKDMTHLIGINAGGAIAQRSRIAWLSTASSTSDIPLVTWSADGCLCENIHFFSGLDDANMIGALSVTGDRNVFRNCHIAGIGHATNDAAGAYSLSLSGDENLFENCVIGLDTIARGTAANSEILLTGGGARNIFRNCYIITYAEANTHQFLIKESAGVDRFCLFDNCMFINAIQSGATQMTEAFDITAGGSPNGLILLKDCGLLGATDWEAATVSGEVYSFSQTSTGNVTGLAVAVAAS
jgi:hypothetical protein